MELKIYLNGKIVNKSQALVSVFDHGLLYGDGVFEGIRVYNQLIFKFEEHLDRLFRSAHGIKLKIPLSKKELIGATIKTLQANKIKDGYIRLVVTRGTGDLGLDPRKCPEPTLFIITDKIKLYPEEFYQSGLRIITSRTRRNDPKALDPRIKSLNYLNNIMAKLDAIEKKAEECVMLNKDDYVAECSGDNIFIVKHGALYAPPASLGALEGITAATVIDIAHKKGIRFSWTKMRLSDIYGAEECFLSGTAAEIIPVTALDGRKIGSGKPGVITLMLRQEFQTRTAGQGVRYAL